MSMQVKILGCYQPAIILFHLAHLTIHGN